jgi:hypothetical protein
MQLSCFPLVSYVGSHRVCVGNGQPQTSETSIAAAYGGLVVRSTVKLAEGQRRTSGGSGTTGARVATSVSRDAEQRRPECG